MRNITKNNEPHSLTEHKKREHADYGNYAEKDDLRKSLVEEQKGICCYCMSRIRPSSDGMKIEHWQCRNNHQARQLDYRNLLGVCLGGQGSKGQDQHCDTYKGDKDLSINPSDPTCDVERLVKFLGDGRIGSDDENIESELDSVLNLNHHLLVSNRKSVLQSFTDILSKVKVNDGFLQRELKKWNGDNGGELEPFNQVVVFYLRKRLGIAA